MKRDGKQVSKLMIAMIMGLMLLCIGPLASVSAQEATAAGDVRIVVNGEPVKKLGLLFIADDRLYVPVARIAELLGASSSWDQDNEELTIHTALNDEIVLGNGVPVVYFNGVRYVMDAFPYQKNDRLYMPLRQLAEMLHASMNAVSEANVVELDTVKPAVVSDTNGFAQIAKLSGNAKAELLQRNELDGKKAQELAPGTKLKVVVPSFFARVAKPYTEADYALLAKITMVEAGYEPYEGQLALANVILNRVKDARFPDTIRDVIYSGRQFPPAHNGLLDKTKPNASALRAAKDALNGRNNVEGAVYFYNPSISQLSFFTSLDTVATIGHHTFAK